MSDEGIKIYSDGGARGNPGPAAAAFVVIEKEKVIFSQSRYLGITTNNAAEYKGVIMALSWILNNIEKFKVKKTTFFLDSELVVNQLSGNYKIKNKNLKLLIEKAKKLEKKIVAKSFSIKNISLKIIYKYIPRSKNKLADHLVNKSLNEKL